MAEKPNSIHAESPTAERAAELARVFEQHNQELVAFLTRRLGGDEAQAREVAQEAYVRILRLDQTDTVSFFKAYLYRTASNLAVDRLRVEDKDRQIAASVHHEQQDDRSPERIVGGQEELAVLKQAVAELPPRYRLAFELSRLRELATAEVGRRLGLKPIQTRLYLRRALAYCQLRVDGVSAQQARTRIFP